MQRQDHTMPAGLLMAAIAAAFVALGAMLPVSVATAQGDIIREGAGDRRDALDAMELRPVEASIYDALSGWAEGSEVTAADAEGQVVVFYTWSSFLRSSTRPMRVLNKLHEAHTDDGLVIIGVHHEKGWDQAAATAQRLRAQFPIAHDADGLFRKTLLVDQDPDFYIVDRAGQLRYADIDLRSVETAVDELLAESASHAAGTQDRLDEAEADAAARARRSRMLRHQLRLSRLPDIAFPRPSPLAYQDLDWPTLSGFGNNSNFDRNTEIQVSMPTGARWYHEMPNPGPGRLTIVFFWSVDGSLGASHQAFDMMQQVQREHVQDAVVVGAFAINQPRNSSQNDNARQRRVREASARLAEVVENKEFNFSIVDQISQTELTDQILSNGNGSSGSQNNQSLAGYCAVIDSNGRLRWRGRAMTHRGGSFHFTDRFRGAVDRMLAVDPGVQARRKAEADFIDQAVEEGLGIDEILGGGQANDDWTLAEDDGRPSPEAYAAADWPEHNTRSMLATNLQGFKLPVGLSDEQWLSDEPSAEALSDRIVILEFWAVWCGPCRQVEPRLKSMQEQNTDTLTIVGLSGVNEPLSRIEAFLDQAPPHYAQAYDPDLKIYNSLQIRGIPHAVVLSTDGVIRWQGNPLEPEFEEVVAQIIEADPLVSGS